ncbi:hypothetical protein INS49_007671 [Diaporthe citri]|uniref:uncharacterized protein n=1 Tax=Diaporthe citri TaxID=83186 RepID=UPI001C812F81|nr:uncharacterized protein INS49_007671 [Diaporthe citri]KAG6362579.1 hypothetical protein INS49_007671 [Diaporthe citri]
MTIPSAFGYDAKFSELPVKHCMAEPNPEYTCKLGLAPPLLLIVIGCVFIKGAICTGILFGLTDNSLVTPGDAISSFISQPDPNTVGLATMGFTDADRLEYDSLEKVPASGLLHGPMARRWRHCPRRFKSVLSRAVWVRTYSILIAGMALISTGLGLDVTGNGASTLIGTFGKAATTNIAIQFTYLGALLMANTPQLILSFCYFALNSFLTRIQVEEEWNSYSRSYKPLRVSNPKGQQVSHYRLQLPYKYSIPLIGMSIVLHWVLSNAIFLTIIEGGFWANINQDASMAAGFGVSDDSYIAVGVSGSAILALFVISSVLCISLALFSLRKLSGDMVSGGTNSLVMSAACHVPAIAMRSKPLSARRSEPASRSNVTLRSTSTGASSISSYQQVPSIEGVDIVPEGPLSPYHFSAKSEPSSKFGQQQEAKEDEEQLLSGVVAGDEETTLLEEVATSRIRWGAIPANPGILEGVVTDEVVLHLGFGTEDHNVQPPCEGRLYI